jgi:hypothetical protein
MASTAQVLASAVGHLDYDALGERNVLLCLAAITSGRSNMATAQELITTAVAAGFDALSDRDLKEALLYAAQPTGPLTAQQCVTGAAANKYSALSDKDLGEALLDVIT